MAFDYRPVDRDQAFLFPPDVRDWLPAGHLAWFVLDVVAGLDTSSLHARHPNAGVGRRAYDPEMLFALLVYAYCCGARSSRRVEALCEVDVAYRVVTANQFPDHSTIARFRQGHEAEARRLFTQVLELCERAGMVNLGVVAVDGTKMAANASAKANRTRRQIEQEVAQIFAEAEATDAAEDRLFGPARGDELPEGLRERKGRAARLQAILAELEARPAVPARPPAQVGDGAKDKRDRARAGRALARAEAGLAHVEAEMASPGSKLARAEAALAEAIAQADEIEARRHNRGGPRKTPHGKKAAQRRATRDRQVALSQRRHARALARAEKARARVAQLRARGAGRAAQAQARVAKSSEQADEARVNLTDPGSRLMKSPRGWVQGYNAQAAVAQSGVIIATAVNCEHSDTANCVPMMAAVRANLEAVGAKGKVGTMLFDAGYLSEGNLVAPGPPRLIATAKSYKLRRAAKENGYRQGEPPVGARPVQAMEHRLLTEEGGRLYSMRQHVVEPVFGHTKHNRGFRRFMRRGQAAASSEWDLITATHNLLKLHRHIGLTALGTT
jgi:transposase